jgi:hypothetical protein
MEIRRKGAKAGGAQTRAKLRRQEYGGRSGPADSGETLESVVNHKERPRL